MEPNSYELLLRRRDAGALTWYGPALMLFARAAFAVAAQALVAAVFALRGSPTPWRDAEPWLPVYGTLIDAGCLALLWHLTRREGIHLAGLVGFKRQRFGRDVLLGLALIPVSLVFILGGVYAAGWVLYGTLTPPFLFGLLPLPAALYGVLVQTVPPLFWAEGTDLVDPETGKALFHQETGQKIFQWFQDLIYVHEISPSGEATMDSEAANRMFASGTLASNWHHSSQWAEWIALAREGVLGTSFQPSFTGEIAPASTEGGWTLCMSKGANEEAAWKLIDFFQSNEAELIDAEVGGELPTRKSALEDPFFQGEEFTQQREWLDYLAEHGHPATTIKIEHRQELANILGDAAQRIIAGQADVASTLTDAAAQYDALVG